MLTDPQQSVLRHLRRCGGLSRGELAEALDLRPNTAGDAVAALIDHRLLREDAPDRSRPGRPRVPVRIDPQGRTLLGVALTPRHIHLTMINALGRSVTAQRSTSADPGSAAKVAAGLIRDAIKPSVWSVGITAPGIVDRQQKFLTLSGLAPGSAVALKEIFTAAGDTPVTLDNDMHALAARWWLTQGQPTLPNTNPTTDNDGAPTNRSDHPVHPAHEDVLLVRVGDGALGASLLIDGRPNRGCVIGGNELGHTRLPVATPRCYCGHAGCLERIVSTAFLHQRGASAIRTLAELCSAWPSGNATDDDAVAGMLDLLATGLGNAVNFTRPHRLILVSELSRYPAFYGALMQRLRQQMLPGVAEHVAVERWDQPLATPGETAAYLALAGLYDDAWLG